MHFHIDELLIKAFEKGASDLHITVNYPPTYRVNGELSQEGTINVSPMDAFDMAKHMLADNWDEFLEKKEFDFSYEIDEVSRFRVNAFFQRQNISIAARVIPTRIPTVEELGLPHGLEKLAEKPQGLILVTGPTGSGKSTTLAAMISYINRMSKKHIITLEDPIEYYHENVRSIVQQREVGLDTHEFQLGLRAALRQDPDIILVGEMRDLETISTAITAAETGHLVLATLHTNSAAQTINRIIDVFPPHQQGQIRIQLASVLSAIISQRLLPRIDIPGRVVATEVLREHPGIANLIRTEKIDQIDNILQTSKALGMHTIAMSISELIQAGKISYEQGQAFVENIGDYT